MVCEWRQFSAFAVYENSDLRNEGFVSKFGTLSRQGLTVFLVLQSLVDHAPSCKLPGSGMRWNTPKLESLQIEDDVLTANCLTASRTCSRMDQLG